MQAIITGTNNYNGERNISIQKAILLLKKNNIQVDEDEAAEILNFLYHIAKTCSKAENDQYNSNLKEKSNQKKLGQECFKHTF